MQTMAPGILLLVLLLSISAWSLPANAATAEIAMAKSNNQTSRGIHLPQFSMPDPGCVLENRRAQLLETQDQQVKVSLRHRSSELRINHNLSHKSLLLQSLRRDSFRVTTFKNKITQNAFIRSNPQAHLSYSSQNSSSDSKKMMKNELLEVESTVESGASLGAGEYVMDVLVGSPPQHFSLIIDTGSDLTWLQCKPCNDCYNQAGPVFDPSISSSYKPVSCSSPACGLVQHSDCPAGQEDQTKCSYFYSYGDSSQTNGDLAVETLSINLSNVEEPTQTLEIRDMVIGCGHSNKGLFQGAGGLIGLGQGALSFSSQLKSSSIGHGFSYCLVDRNSNMSVKSLISFGDDAVLAKSFSSMNFTPFVKSNTSVDTFYYLGLRGLKVDDETLRISPSRFAIAENGTGGTIIDSGTTITYLDTEAYQELEKALLARIKYPRAGPFDVLRICYNTSGFDSVSFPAFKFLFENGAELELPQKNYFIQPDPEEPFHCLAIVPTTGLSIIGNFQQQDIHLLYDLKNSRLGFARTNCAKIL